MRAAAAFAITSLLVGTAAAEPSAPTPAETQLTVGPPVEVVIPGERPTTNVVALSVTAGLAAVALGLGAAYHIGSRSVANDLAAKEPTGKVWTAEDERDYHRGQDDKTRAETFYAVGGVLLVGAVVAFVVTAPKSRKEVIHPHLSTMVTPTSGGAFISHGWTW
ncbi:MAG TPA: hypothetical protein VGM88_22970 [Kofleriaceae bacterium]|jgi:hypothetical protein